MAKHRVICFITFLFFITAQLYFPVEAAAVPSISAPSYVLLEPASNKILFSRSPHRRQPAASTTKVMTALVAMKRLDLNDWVTIGSAVESIPPSKLYLQAGERVKVRDLLKAALIKSANDAATQLAIAVSGSERRFGKLMTKEARKLGARDTRFVNASGLPEKGQYSTAYDLALIMRKAMQNRFIVSTLQQKYAVIKTAGGKRYEIKSHNKMLWRKQDVIGKTGWTRKSRYCFLGVIRTAHRKAIVSMLGSHKLWRDLSKIIQTSYRLLGIARHVLKKGARGEDVRKLQAALKRAGYFDVQPTGYFGNITKRSIKNFQRNQGLHVDGVAGPKTRAALSPYD